MHEGLRELLRRQVVDPDAEAREREEREEHHAPARAGGCGRRAVGARGGDGPEGEHDGDLSAALVRV